MLVNKYLPSILIVLFCVPIIANAGDISCSQWMDTSLHGEYQTEKIILESCDDKTFKVFNHEYAKDKNVVYFKPMPNMTNMAIIIKVADPETFKKTNRCDHVYADKNYVYSFDKVVEGVDSKTYCH